MKEIFEVDCNVALGRGFSRETLSSHGNFHVGVQEDAGQDGQSKPRIRFGQVGNPQHRAFGELLCQGRIGSVDNLSQIHGRVPKDWNLQERTEKHGQGMNVVELIQSRHCLHGDSEQGPLLSKRGSILLLLFQVPLKDCHEELNLGSHLGKPCGRVGRVQDHGKEGRSNQDVGHGKTCPVRNRSIVVECLEHPSTRTPDGHSFGDPRESGHNAAVLLLLWLATCYLSPF